MCPRNMYSCISKLINKYLSTVKHDAVIKGFLFFNLAYKSGNLNSISFETFNKFICTKLVSAPEYSENNDTDINVLKELYTDLSSMSQFIKDDNILSLVHELSFNSFNRKESGIYYTPEEVIKPILDRLFNDIDIISNPYIKIFDPACGCGNFLCCAYDKLYEIFSNNSDKLSECFGYLWDEKYIKRHILQNNIFGADIDGGALEITLERLALISGSMDFYTNNIVLCNSLFKWEEEGHNDRNIHLSSLWRQNFDFIIGNPPYQNMQKSNTEFKEYVKLNYPEVYNGQNDLYYYFIYRSIDRLKEGGKLCFIVPPYFIKSTYGEKLRNYIISNFNIHRLEDITSLKPFYKTQIHSCIFEGAKKAIVLHNYSDKKVYINNNHNVLLANNDKWTIADNNTIAIIEKLEKLSKLGNHASICKGMDTGLNECFLVNQDVIGQYNLEQDLLRPVTRSGDIGKYYVNRVHSNAILYITNQTDISRFPNAKKYLMKFYERLKLRWAYKRKLCNWYSISTPRSAKYFESKNMRLFVPYRSDINKFALDSKSSIGLTDTTAIFTRDDLDIYYLAGVLNSKLISFYNSFCGKRKGDMFEFFSVPISNFPFIDSKDRLYYEIIENVKNILDASNDGSSNVKRDIHHIREYIDNVVFEVYNIGDESTKIITNYLNNKIYFNYLG